MELKYGTKRVFEISIIAAIAFSFCAYIAIAKSPGVAFGILVITLWTFRGILRFFFCSKWIKVEASTNKTADIANIKLDWRGVATDLARYRVNIEYSVDGKLYETDIFLNQLPGKRLHVYYKPDNPEIISSNIGLGWEGITFLLLIPLLALYGIFN
jgi:hypothetical protein